MENYYQRNMDQFEGCDNGKLSYNQILDYWFNEDSGEPTEPVTLEEAKNFCKIDVDDDDTLITSLITAARRMCEDYTNIGFINREVTAVINNGNGGSYLPYGPIGEILSITDNDGAELEADIQGVQWKQVVSPRLERMTVVYSGGYEVLPNDLKTALLNVIMWLYDNRSQGTTEMGPIAPMILNPVKRIW